jgi:hypothetical protein
VRQQPAPAICKAGGPQAARFNGKTQAFYQLNSTGHQEPHSLAGDGVKERAPRLARQSGLHPNQSDLGREEMKSRKFMHMIAAAALSAAPGLALAQDAIHAPAQKSARTPMKGWFPRWR